MKRKALRAVQKIADVFYIVGEITWIGALMIWEGCDRAIQRDLDKERNLKEVRESQEAEKEQQEAPEAPAVEPEKEQSQEVTDSDHVSIFTGSGKSQDPV